MGTITLASIAENIISSTNISQLALFTIVDVGNFNFTLGHKVILVDVFVQQQFVYNIQQVGKNSKGAHGRDW